MRNPRRHGPARDRARRVAASRAARRGSTFAAAASVLFLAGSAVPALAWVLLAPPALRATGALVIELRDFAVAAALAGQAFGPAAATVSGVYGVLMLLLGAGAAHLMPRLAARYAATGRAQSHAG